MTSLLAEAGYYITGLGTNNRFDRFGHRVTEQRQRAPEVDKDKDKDRRQAGSPSGHAQLHDGKQRLRVSLPRWHKPKQEVSHGRSLSLGRGKMMELFQDRCGK